MHGVGGGSILINRHVCPFTHVLWPQVISTSILYYSQGCTRLRRLFWNSCSASTCVSLIDSLVDLID